MSSEPGTGAAADHEVLASVACLVGCLAKYTSLFHDALRKEFLPRDADVIFDWQLNLRLVRFGVLPLEELLQIESERGLKVSDMRVMPDRDITNGQFLCELKMRLDFARSEMSRQKLVRAGERIFSASYLLSVWKRELYASVCDERPEVRDQLRQEVSGGTLPKSSVFFGQLLGLLSNRVADGGQFPSEDYVMRELQYQRSRFEERIKCLRQESSDWRQVFAVCMASRKSYLAYFFAAYFGVVAHPHLKVEHECQENVRLYEEAIDALPDNIISDAGCLDTKAKLDDCRNSMTERRDTLKSWKVSEFVTAALEPTWAVT